MSSPLKRGSGTMQTRSARASGQSCGAAQIWACPDDLVDDLSCKVWLWATENFRRILTAPTNASMPTRLYARAEWVARAWRTETLRARARLSPLDCIRETLDHCGNRKFVVLTRPESDAA